MNRPEHPQASHFGGIAHARHADALTLHLSIGADLVHLKIDRRDFSLSEIGRLALPAPVQYVVPHPARSLLYVASSNRWIPNANNLHVLTTVEVDARTGTLRAVGQATLPARPIHLTVTQDGAGVLVAYNAPAGVSWHAIDGDGVAGGATVQDPPPLGAYPHQVRVLPSGEAAVVVVRGNHAAANRAEEPGSLRFLGFDGGVFEDLGVVAPNGGLGFGPRHLDFHPGGRWAALSMERENEVQVFAVHDRGFDDVAAFKASTLSDARAAAMASDHDQLCSAIHFHPRGHALYVANRHDPAVYGREGEPCDHDGNDIAVHAFDAASGRLQLLQHIATDSVHVRTFSLDETGRLLVAASILPALERRDGHVARVPARLSFFRVAEDGTLTLAKVQDMPDSGQSMFWSHVDGRL